MASLFPVILAILLHLSSSTVHSQLPAFSPFWLAGPPGFQDGFLFPRIHTYPLRRVYYKYGVLLWSQISRDNTFQYLSYLLHLVMHVTIYFSGRYPIGFDFISEIWAELEPHFKVTSPLWHLPFCIKTHECNYISKKWQKISLGRKSWSRPNPPYISPHVTSGEDMKFLEVHTVRSA